MLETAADRIGGKQGFCRSRKPTGQGPRPAHVGGSLKDCLGTPCGQDSTLSGPTHTMAETRDGFGACGLSTGPTHPQDAPNHSVIHSVCLPAAPWYKQDRGLCSGTGPALTELSIMRPLTRANEGLVSCSCHKCFTHTFGGGSQPLLSPVTALC